MIRRFEKRKVRSANNGVQGGKAPCQGSGGSATGGAVGQRPTSSAEPSETHRKINLGRANTEIIKIQIRPSYGWRKRLPFKNAQSPEFPTFPTFTIG